MTQKNCKECHRRKVKCDKQRPVCSRCANRSVTCCYEFGVPLELPSPRVHKYTTLLPAQSEMNTQRNVYNSANWSSSYPNTELKSPISAPPRVLLPSTIYYEQRYEPTTQLPPIGEFFGRPLTQLNEPYSKAANDSCRMSGIWSEDDQSGGVVFEDWLQDDKNIDRDSLCEPPYPMLEDEPLYKPAQWQRNETISPPIEASPEALSQVVENQDEFNPNDFNETRAARR